MNDGLIYKKLIEVEKILRQKQIDCDDILDLLDDIKILVDAKDSELKRCSELEFCKCGSNFCYVDEGKLYCSNCRKLVVVNCS